MACAHDKSIKTIVAIDTTEVTFGIFKMTLLFFFASFKKYGLAQTTQNDKPRQPYTRAKLHYHDKCLRTIFQF